MIHAEYGDDGRIVPLTKTHAPRVTWSRMGDSIGHWEGDTLVIETVGQPDADRVHIAPTLIVPGDATVIERLTPISDRELLYQFTVVDPKTYAAPWLGEFSWFRTDKLMYEHACHEGNYSLPNILAGARHEEAVAAGPQPARADLPLARACLGSLRLWRSRKRMATSSSLRLGDGRAGSGCCVGALFFWATAG